MPRSNWRLKASLTQIPPLPDNKSVQFGFLETATTTIAPPAQAPDFVAPPLLFEGNRQLLQADLGLTRTDSNGALRVWIDDYTASNSFTFNRTWYDGVGVVQAVPEGGGAGMAIVAAGLFAVRRGVARLYARNL
jgi:hypothetical protein